jgi:integrase
LLGRMSNTFRPIAASCALAGLRVSEALGLTWGDVDFDTKTITVSKQLGTSGERVPTKTPSSHAPVPLLPALERELRAHRSRQASRNLRFTHRDALVFSTTRGKPQSRRNVLRAVQHAGDEVGLNGEGRQTVGLHDLRHSFVAIALANGVTLPEAAMLARHANPRVTLAVYAGLTDGARKNRGQATQCRVWSVTATRRPTLESAVSAGVAVGRSRRGSGQRPRAMRLRLSSPR